MGEPAAYKDGKENNMQKNTSILITIGMTVVLATAQTVAPPAPAPKPAVVAAPVVAPATASPAPAKPVVAKAAPVVLKGNPQVDRVIDLAKNKMSEAFIIKDLKKTNKSVNLTPADMGRLKQAGVSEAVMDVMMDPASGPGPVAAAPSSAPPAAVPEPVAAAPAPAVTVVETVSTTSTTSTTTATPAAAPTRAQKKRVIVDPFDYSAVMTAVQTVFGSQQNIGKGIQAMMVTRLHQGDKLVIVDRAKLKEVLTEQDSAAGNRVKQGSGARIGRISGADAIIAGDIVVFGHDDKKKGGGAAFAGALCKLCGAIATSKKEEKFVVVINYRLIDAETTEVIATGEARGESQRTSRSWAGIGAALGGGAAAAVDMTSSNFMETIIGEATQNCVNQLAEILTKQGTDMKKTVREVEALVVDVVNAGVLMIQAGTGDGVNVGEVFEVFHIDREVLDPVTKEPLDRVTTKVGEMTISSVRDKVSLGSYTGSPAAVKTFVARKKMPAQQ